ncbi:hypothetical protein MVEN_00455800 [Mycena venus]|uniref:Uncharacterized protein n=1 Tax=Mycena venus TaxID=2733690 RepID=A0A8H7DAQ1_9AGAR|nr:hypothetical protein MVEN_00455800 [Mycena venus]
MSANSELQVLTDLTPVKVVQNGDKTDSVDQAQLLSRRIFNHLLMHALPKGRGLFYPKLGNLGDNFDNNLVNPSGSAAIFGFKSILDDDHDVLFQLAMHALCSELTKVSWLSHQYKKYVQDKFASFAELLGSHPENLATNAKSYGWDLGSRKSEFDSLQQKYLNALQRCYFGSWVHTQPAWQTYLQDPTRWFNELSSRMKSPEFHAKFVMQVMRAEPGALKAEEQISQFHDKLMLLRIASGNSGLDIDTPVKALAKAAIDEKLIPQDWHTDPLHLALSGAPADVAPHGKDAEMLRAMLSAEAAAMGVTLFEGDSGSPGALVFEG